MKKIYGLLGETLSYSISDSIHEIIMKENNISGVYNMFEVKKQDLEKGLEGFKAIGVRGVNVTIPYKQEVMKYLDDISQEAKEIGAVNTIVFDEGKLYGHNTDYFGFKMNLQKANIEIRDKSFVILGSGGAAKAVIKCLKDFNARDIVITARNKEKAQDFFKDLEVIAYENLKDIKSNYCIINTTPCGTYPDVESSVVGEDVVSMFENAVDLIYNPKETKFLSYGKKHEINHINGLYMLVGQAIKAQEIWNNIKIDESSAERIYKQVEKLI